MTGAQWAPHRKDFIWGREVEERFGDGLLGAGMHGLLTPWTEWQRHVGASEESSVPAAGTNSVAM